ncbi:substrate-binding domain-containing protein [Neptuniibacter caesariensis]|uniref:ABC-type sugar transport system, periplasmic component n=1 Tax=Neptuniibacter caesariensis TaxID=207954 RepID=A0A7U8C4M7_NEPCE|nr:substrate-binding domain-containing protein [Neptuniibacter caesariensis]EAR61139.1 ABC-type sugar transport system, periplasmic component [Oceanospirillum sp. MED92] [Neptuniibacter caesariensis]
MQCLSFIPQWAGLIIGLIFSINCIADTEYIRVSSFIKEHPEQHSLMEHFGELVRQPPSPLTVQKQKTIKIAVIYPGVQSSDYWRRSLITFKTRLNELRISHELKTFLSRPGVDKDLQAEQLTEALAWQPNYLIFSADALDHQNTIQRILLQGKPKLILQNITTPLKLWASHPPFLYTGFDHEIGTQLLAERMITPDHSQYAMLFFAPGYVSKMRGGTFISEAKQQKGLSPVASFYTGGNRGKARAATLKTLSKNPDVDMFFACSTDIALGVSDALDELKLHDQILVNGWGGGDAELEALLAGKLDLTVMRLNDDASVAMAEAIKLDLNGSSHLVPQIYSGDIVLLDRSTTKEEIQNYKNRAFRYSNAAVKQSEK